MSLAGYMGMAGEGTQEGAEKVALNTYEHKIARTQSEIVSGKALRRGRLGNWSAKQAWVSVCACVDVCVGVL